MNRINPGQEFGDATVSPLTFKVTLASVGLDVNGESGEVLIRLTNAADFGVMVANAVSAMLEKVGCSRFATNYRV